MFGFVSEDDTYESRVGVLVEYECIILRPAHVNDGTGSVRDLYAHCEKFIYGCIPWTTSVGV